MLIENDKFNLKEFKEKYKSLDWQRYPRKLGPNHTDYFYIGRYDDDDWSIKVKIRPSLRMDISESYKHCDEHGNKINASSKKKFTFGKSVEVVIDSIFLDKIKKVSRECDSNKVQKVSW